MIQSYVTSVLMHTAHSSVHVGDVSLGLLHRISKCELSSPTDHISYRLLPTCITYNYIWYKLVIISLFVVE